MGETLNGLSWLAVTLQAVALVAVVVLITVVVRRWRRKDR